MRWSAAFIPTLRDDPADADAVSHKLLVRGGFIRQLMSGSYSLLPAGFRVAARIEQIIREEINAIGGQEMAVPVLQPAEVWQASGRLDIVELFKVTDRRDVVNVLALTHEEVFTLTAAELNSYRELPQLWFHLQTKLRDEARPKGGLLRVREFTMKDSYSFDLDAEGLDRQFNNHRAAYHRIFERLGMQAIAVEASSGVMGGAESVEFMVPSPAGEDDVAVCGSCDYAANVEKATARLEPVDDGTESGALERFDTPGIRTIAALADGFDFADAQHQIKTMVYVVGDELVLALLRGDHELVEQKLMDGLAVSEARQATAEEIRPVLGADAGSLGAVGVADLMVVADPALRGRFNMTTGANEDDVHYRGVDVERDIGVSQWLDLRLVRAGEPCPNCGQPLDIQRVIEIGHIFKLGTEYSAVLGASVLDADGREVPVVMGSYGIGVGRNMAAVVEVHHDDNGIVWPVGVGPYDAVVTVLRTEGQALTEGERIYNELGKRGVETILDDRDERPGVKFADSELVGIPVRVTVGPRGLESGVVELTIRATGETTEVALDDVIERVIENLNSMRP